MGPVSCTKVLKATLLWVRSAFSTRSLSLECVMWNEWTIDHLFMAMSSAAHASRQIWKNITWGTQMFMDVIVNLPLPLPPALFRLPLGWGRAFLCHHTDVSRLKAALLSGLSKTLDIKYPPLGKEEVTRHRGCNSSLHFILVTAGETWLKPQWTSFSRASCFLNLSHFPLKQVVGAGRDTERLFSKV